MRIPTILLVLLAGLAPIGIVVSLIVVPSNVKWQPPVIWETKFGTPGINEGNRITTIAADKTGLYAIGYVGFSFQGPSNPTPSYSFLKKFDFGGREVWSQQLGNITNISAIGVGGDGVYYGDYFSRNSTVFVEKHDLDGNRVWTRNFGNISADSPFGMSVGSSGLYIAGLAPPNGSYVPRPLIMRSCDTNGSVVWTRALTNQLPGVSILVYAAPNGVFLAGSGSPFAPGRQIVDTHAFIAHYDMSGAQVWYRPFDNPPSFECACVTNGLTGDSSGIYLGGTSYESFYNAGSFLRKYDWNGNTIWTTGEAGSGIGRLSVSQSGIYALRGGLERYDAANGNSVWSVSVQGTVADLGVGTNGVYVGGGESSRVDSGAALLVGYDQSASLVLGGVNPPYSFLILGAVAGVVVIGILLVRRSSMSKNIVHSEGEIPEKRVSGQRQDAAGQWWVEKQLAKRAAEKWPGLDEEKDRDSDEAGSDDHKSS